MSTLRGGFVSNQSRYQKCYRKYFTVQYNKPTFHMCNVHTYIQGRIQDLAQGGDKSGAYLMPISHYVYRLDM